MGGPRDQGTAAFDRFHPAVREGLLRHGRGELDEAAALYRLAHQDGQPDAEALLLEGVVARQRGEFDKAISLTDEAVLLRPQAAHYRLNLGMAFAGAKRWVEAAIAFESAIQMQPRSVETLTHLAQVLLRLGRSDEAVRCAARAVLLVPERAAAHHLLGRALKATSDLDRSEQHFREAVRLEPGKAEYWNSVGGVLIYRKPSEQAEACYRIAVGLKPEYSAAHVNLGTALKLLGRLDEMRTEYEEGLRLDPDSSGARFNLALADLRDGRYLQGWAGHEARWDFAELRMRPRIFKQPQWQGEELAGRTILLHAEQGFGDTLQFVRFAPLVAALGGRIVLEVQPGLCTLLTGMAGVSQVLARGDRLPEFAVHCPLMSLGHVFRTTLEAIPSQEGYLSADDAAVAQAWIRFPGDGFRVGVVWSGNRTFRTNAERSVPVEALDRLSGLEGIRWFSMQQGVGSCPPWMADAGSRFADFAETAAMMKTLDLVISVDTSTAHLAGSLGIPVWVLLQKIADWRWLDGREDSPWYQSARLFRQNESGDWREVLDRVTNTLQQAASPHRPDNLQVDAGNLSEPAWRTSAAYDHRSPSENGGRRGSAQNRS